MENTPWPSIMAIICWMKGPLCPLMPVRCSHVPDSTFPTAGHSLASTPSLPSRFPLSLFPPPPRTQKAACRLARWRALPPPHLRRVHSLCPFSSITGSKVRFLDPLSCLSSSQKSGFYLPHAAGRGRVGYM